MINLQARVWIYQSNRVLKPQETNQLDLMLSSFTNEWTAHNQQLKAYYEVRYNRFIILVVDEAEAGASGCSIDKSVRLMKEIESEFDINLFDRFNIAWKEGEEIYSGNREEFELKIKEGKINSETTVFNNLVTDYANYLENWETPFSNSWHSKVFKLESVL
ncbi:MAG: ABC transporter ATPase [Pelobium sp.]